MKHEERMQKLAEDTRALRYASYQDQLKDMIERLGGDPQVLLKEDIDDNIPILMNAKTLVKEMNELDLFTKDALGQYTVLNKISAITVMTASLMVDDYKNEIPVPQYSAVSQWLGIPSRTLRRWWAGSAAIFAEQTALGYASVMRSTFKQIQAVEKYTDALLAVDANKLVESAAGINAANNTVRTMIFMAELLHTKGSQFANVGNKGKTVEHKDSKVEFVIPEQLERGK